ncbi:MgtC/SapB family protein [candidate division KSB1 bacterium]|nr:MgtC/SapB family protein [candidate division KSB1 bacterium]
MEHYSIFYRFGVALIIGFLVGLQREYAFKHQGKELAAGVRTFSLISLIGCTAAMMTSLTESPLPFIAIISILGLLVTVNYFIQAWRGESGLTTEVAALMTALAGALVYWNNMALGVALAVTTTILLSFKLELHSFARHLTKPDIFSTLKFAVISVIILPVLPNKVYGPEPFNIFNPYKIWLLIVFISGISFIGYILIKIIGPRKGISLTGLLGGLASSTAVTLSFTQRSRDNTTLAKPFALAILIAWTVMFARVLILVAAINSSMMKLLWIPLTASMFAGLIYCFYLYRAQHYDAEKEHVSFSNPFELGPAIKFGILFTLILFVSKAAQIYMGSIGLYFASIVAGLADVDAITLSVAKLSQGSQGISHIIAVRAVVFACVANTFVKGVIVLIGSDAGLKRAILPGFLLMMATSLVVAFLI